MPVLLEPGRRLATAAVAALVALAVVVTATHFETRSLVLPVGGVILAATATWMALTRHTAVALSVLLLYVGLLDGYLKLRSGHDAVTFVRDALLYAIAIGVLFRWLRTRSGAVVPPFSWWVLASAGVALVQIANPNTEGLGAGVVGVRQAIEFAPLFILVFFALDSTERLRVTTFLLLFVAAANAIVSLVQFNLTPAQFAAWGPGYAQRVLGTGQISIRYFVDAAGTARVRPFGLGSDEGVGGAFALVAIPGALALLATERSWRNRIVVLGLLALAVSGVATSQTRSIVIGTIVAVFFFLALVVTSRRRGRVLFVVFALLGALVMLGSVFASAAFSRYAGLSSLSGLRNAFGQRSAVYPSFLYYLTHIPLGDGLASAGPASSAFNTIKRLNADSQFNFMLIETGIPGLLCFTGFLASVLLRVARQVPRVVQDEARVLLAGLLAPLLGLTAMCITGPVTTAPPTAPYFWAAAGLVSRWLYPRTRGPVHGPRHDMRAGARRLSFPTRSRVRVRAPRRSTRLA